MDLSNNQGNLKIVVTNGYRTVTTAFGICTPHNAIVQMSRQAKMTLLDHGYIGEIFPVSPDSTGDQGRQGQCHRGGRGVGERTSSARPCSLVSNFC